MFWVFSIRCFCLVSKGFLGFLGVTLGFLEWVPKLLFFPGCLMVFLGLSLVF